MAHEPHQLGLYLPRVMHDLVAEALIYYSTHPGPNTTQKDMVRSYANALRTGKIYLLETPNPRPIPPKWEAGCGTPGKNDGRQLVHTSWSDAAEQLLDWMAELDTVEGHDVSIQGRRRREVHGIGANNEGWVRAIGRAWWIRKVEGDGTNP